MIKIIKCLVFVEMKIQKIEVEITQRKRFGKIKG